MKKLGILAAMAVMITGFLTLGAGTAHAGWAIKDECFDGHGYPNKKHWYKLMKRNTNNWGVKYCNTDWCTWTWNKKDVSETKARNGIPCL